MNAVRGTVLLTGFEPFDGQGLNASWAAAQEVARTWTGPGRLVTTVLPVSFRGARQALRAAVAEHAPVLVVCLGEDGRRGSVGVERVARNLIDARIPDNDGSAPVDVPVIEGAPTALVARLPVTACVAAGRAAGVAVEVSDSAGTYVCNATFYALLHLLASRPGVAGGFVHVPRIPGQVAAGAPAMCTADAARAVHAVLLAASAGVVG